MTKQNDMPETIYLIHHADGEGNHAWSTDPDPTGYIQEVDTTKYVRTERADKPADNGGIVSFTPFVQDGRLFARDDKHSNIFEISIPQGYSLTEEPHPPEATTCPDGMSCSGNGMDCVGDGLCKGPEVSGTGLPCARHKMLRTYAREE